MKKAENGFENECSGAESRLKNAINKTEGHPGNEK